MKREQEPGAIEQIPGGIGDGGTQVIGDGGGGCLEGDSGLIKDRHD